MCSQRQTDVRAGLVGLLVFLAALVPWLIITVGWRPRPPEIITDRNDWPEPLQNLSKSRSAMMSSVTVLRLDAFVNQKSVILITDASNLVEELIQQESLEPATSEHPTLKELQTCLPSNWGSPDLSTARIWSSPGYGTEHIEGQNLLLLVHDMDTDAIYILHERIF